MKHLMCALAFGAALAAPASAASVDGLEVDYSSAGQGPTVIFVHGWTCDESSWDGQVPAFTDDYRVVTLDLPGHGDSGAPASADDFSIRLFSDAVEAVRTETGAEKVVLVGHSMGGPVIRQYSLDHPGHVAGLVAVDGPLDLRGIGGFTPPPMTGPEGLANREAFIRSMFVPETSEEVKAHVLSMMLAAPEDTAGGAMAAMFDPALRTDDVIAAPVLAVVAGTGNPPGPESEGILPDLEVVQMEGTGHFLMMEQPGAFNAVLRDFLETRAEF